MPRARRNQPVEAAQTEEIYQDAAATQDSQSVADTPTPAEAAEAAAQDAQATGDTPASAEAAEAPAQDGQAIGDTPAPADEAEAPAQDVQATGDTPAPAEEVEATAHDGQTTSDAPAQPQPPQGTYQLGLTVHIKGGDPSEDIVATADVDLGNICTIRNVKIKEDDYGLKVVMPRTKLPETGRFKDACYFHSVDARVQFDRAVLQSYEQSQALQQESGQFAQEQDGMGGMTM